jgi:hypothetical protein
VPNKLNITPWRRNGKWRYRSTIRHLGTRRWLVVNFTQLQAIIMLLLIHTSGLFSLLRLHQPLLGNGSEPKKFFSSCAYAVAGRLPSHNQLMTACSSHDCLPTDSHGSHLPSAPPESVNVSWLQSFAQSVRVTVSPSHSHSYSNGGLPPITSSWCQASWNSWPVFLSISFFFFLQPIWILTADRH